MLRSRFREVLLAAAWALVLSGDSTATPPQLTGRVVDENSLAVQGARVTLTGAPLDIPLYAISDETGRFLLPSVPPGAYDLRVEKRGFYAFLSRSLALTDRSVPLEVVLNHQQEYEETVNVVYSAPTIDREEAAVQTTLTSEEIIDLPFSATHDFRNALPLIPGVVKDRMGRIHLNGGGENQAFYSLDGFNVTSPVSGILENRISVDAIRAVQVESSRYSAEYGKGSAGAMVLETARGDDRFRFSATNFFPSFEFHDGLRLSNWTPRATFSGPIVRGRAWYFNAFDLQYDLNVVDRLPSSANTNRNWLGSNLTRLQFNITNGNILTTSFLLNFQNSAHLGITPLDPVETSRNRRERFYFFTVKDQVYFSGGWVAEAGFALNQINTGEQPLGDATYKFSPEGRSGNYFLRFHGKVERTQWLANIMAPPWQWRGRHSLKFGLDLDRIRYRQFASRRPFEVLRFSGSLARMVTFSGKPDFGANNFEFSAFVQDRWSPNDRILVEAGMRLDWDQVLREPLWSPRLAATWSPNGSPDAKLSAGIGVFYDATNLGLLTRRLDQQRSEFLFDEDGVTLVQGPIQSIYRADPRHLQAPFYVNWSLGWEQKLPRAFYFRTNFIEKHGRRGWAYDFFPFAQADGTPQYVYALGNWRRENYRYIEFTCSRTFRGKYPWLVSYARSGARSSAVIDFSLENPILTRQKGGPLDWDVPNRLISWAFLPVPHLKKYTVAYFLEWHSGFPYSIVDTDQRLIGSPNSSRLPDYFSLNVHLERRFKMWRYQWALRGGFNNITAHANPFTVNNNIDSPHFGDLSDSQGRVFTGRIRFLGRN